jgi:hypothetical protein
MDNPDEYVDNTKYTRQKIYIDICRIEKLKAELFEFRKESPEEFKDKLKSECPFLHVLRRHIQQALQRRT